MGLASKKEALFSQYSRAADTPVLVSQYSVTLSRMSSRVSALSRVPARARSTSPGWPVPSPWSSMNAARSAGESARPYIVCGRVDMICAYARCLAKKVLSCSYAIFLLGGQIRWRRVAALDCLVDGGRSGPGHVGVNAGQLRRGLYPHRL